MSWTIFLYGLLPLIAFVLVDMIAGIKAGFVSAFLFAVLDIFVMYHSTGQWDPISFVAAALVLILGGMSVRLNNSTYFKFQPVLVGFVLAGFVVYVQFFDVPFVYRYMPLIRANMPPEMQAYLENEEFIELLSSLFNWMIAVIIIHAALVAYAALKCSNLTWLIVRGVGFWVVAVLVLIVQAAYLVFLSPPVIQ